MSMYEKFALSVGPFEVPKRKEKVQKILRD